MFALSIVGCVVIHFEYARLYASFNSCVYVSAKHVLKIENIEIIDIRIGSFLIENDIM